MSNSPTPYINDTSFTELASRPIISSGLPGSQIDSELGSISISLNETISRLGEIQRDDGLLKNGVVSLDSLSDSAKASILASGATIRGAWSASTVYKAGDLVTGQSQVLSSGNNLITYGSASSGSQSTVIPIYLCMVSHSSSTTFANDYLRNLWGNIGGSGGSVSSESNNVVGTNSISTISIQPLAVVDSKINDVSGSKIIDLSIPSGKLAAGSVGTTNLVDTSVTSLKIAGGAITNEKLSVSAVQTVNIQDGAVTTEKIADSNVTTAKIADAQVTTAKIADAQVTTAKIADGSITKAKLNTDIQPSLVPAGAVMPFAMPTAPNGWLQANGQLVSRVTYATLFAAIGTYFGVGDGSTTFPVPDLRGYFVRAVGVNSDGTTSGTFGTKQAESVGPHSHTLYLDSCTGTSSGGTNNSSPQSGSGTDQPYSSTLAIAQSTGTETRPKNIAMLYCIKY